MNHQNFEILILGCSAASPTSERNVSAQLLNIAERYCLIDCGEATQIQLRKYKAKFQKIDHIFISHLHGDHFFGLPGFLSSMHLLGRKQKINIYGSNKLKHLVDFILKETDSKLNYEINWVITSGMFSKIFEDDKIEIYSFPLKHRVECTGFLFKEKTLPRNLSREKILEHKISMSDYNNLKAGKDVVNEEGILIQNILVTIDPAPSRSYAYCSDTAFEPQLCQWLKDADLLYHESTFLEDHKERAKKTFHSTAKQAAQIAQMASVKQLLLGHFSARYRNLNFFLEEAKTEFQNCVLAKDGLRIKI